MIDSVMRITLNLQETNTLISLKAKRGDTGRKLLIHLTDGSIPYPVARDCYAVFTAVKPDGSIIHNPCTIENQVIEYTFTEQTCSCTGTLHCEIRLYGGDRKLLTSTAFLITVFDTVYHEGDEVSSQGEMTTLDDLILRANAFLQETDRLLRWQGSWNSERAYDPYDMVLHQQMLYVTLEAMAAGTVPGTVDGWTPIAGMGTGGGSAGDAYVLTPADKAEIAEMAADLVEAQGPSGGAAGYPDWSHLKWYVMGDSLTAQDNDFTSKRYYDFVKEKTGIQVIVDGIGGTGYGAGTSNGQSFLDRVKNIPEDVDIVTIFGSGNDVLYNVDYNSPIYNALSWIPLNRPGLRVIVVPPAPWKGYQKRSETWKAYCDRLQVCALACDFRYLADLWECPPFNPNFEGHMETFFTTDPEGIHPNEAGHEALATYFYNALALELALRT